MCSRKYILFFFIFLVSRVLVAQDLEKLDETKWLDYSGGVSFSQVYYQASGKEEERDPYFWLLNANLNVSLFELVNVPIHLQLSRERRDLNYRQPFNRFGLSPEYKGLKLHLGYRAMLFSDFTLNGSQFYGIGLEYRNSNTPIVLKSYYGRFSRPIETFMRGDDLFAVTSYRRMGWGVQAGYDHDDHKFLVSINHSADDPASINTDSALVRPEENLVLGVVSGFQLSSRLRIDFEYAYSMFTRDILSDYAFVDEFSFHNNLGGFYEPNATSSFADAFTGTLNYKLEYFSLNTRYRRIAPDYITHGSSFLNNDLSDLTTGISVPLMNHKLNLSSSIGIKHNNVSDQLQSEVRSLAYALSANYKPTKYTMLNVNINNFNTSTRQVVLNTDLISDSLSYFQLNTNFLMAIAHAVGASRDVKLSASFNRQEVTNSENANAKNINVSVGANFKSSNELRYGLNLLLNQRDAGELKSSLIGPAGNISYFVRRLKIRTGAQVRVARNFIENRFNQQVINLRLFGQVKVFKNQSLMLNGNFINRIKEQSNVFEQRVNMVYNWSF